MAMLPWWIDYPNVNNEIINLDWILQISNENTDKIENFIGANTIKYADPILWDITSQYEANTIVVDPQTGDAYISTKPVPYGVHLSNEDYWTKIYNYANAIKTFHEQIAAADEQLSTTASASRSIGDLVWLNDLLYRITAPMIAGDSYVVDSNCTKTTIEEELKREMSARADADTALGKRIDGEAKAREQSDKQLAEQINILNSFEKPVIGQILSAFHNRENAHTEFYLTDDLNRYSPIKWDITVENQPNGDTDVLVGRDGDLFYKDGVLYIATTWSDLSSYSVVIHSSVDLIQWKSHTVSINGLNNKGVIAPTLVEYNNKVYIYGATNEDSTYENCMLFYAELTTLSHENIVAGTPTTFTLKINGVDKSLFDPCLFVYNDILYLAANDKTSSYLFSNNGNLGQFAYVKTITPYAEGTKLLSNSNGLVVGTIQRFHNEDINIYKNYPIDSISFNIEAEDIRGSETLRKECEFLESGRFQSATHGGHIFITPELSQKIGALNIENTIAFAGTGFTEFINLGDFGTYESAEGGIVQVGGLILVPRTIYGAQSNTSKGLNVNIYHIDVDQLVNPFNLTDFYVVFELGHDVRVRITGTNLGEINISASVVQRGRAIHFIKTPVFGWTVTNDYVSNISLTSNNSYHAYRYGNLFSCDITVSSASAGDTLASGLPIPYNNDYVFPMLFSDDGNTVIPCYVGTDGELKPRISINTTVRGVFEYICK